MVSRIIEQQQPICATLLETQKLDFMPSDHEFKTMEEFVLLMKPLVDVTEAIGADKMVHNINFETNAAQTVKHAFCPR